MTQALKLSGTSALQQRTELINGIVPYTLAILLRRNFKRRKAIFDVQSAFL